LILVTLSLGCAGSSGPPDTFAGERKARSHYTQAIEHLRQGRSALAIRDLQAASQIDPNDPWIHVALAEAYRLRGLIDEAEEQLHQALAIQPGMQPALLNLSALYVQAGRFEEAVAQADALLADPTFPVPWKALANKGWAQYKLGEAGEARKSLELAIEYDEGFWPARLSLAVIDVEQGKRLDAIRNLEAVLQQSTGPLAQAEANYRLAEIYISLGNRAKAVKHFTEASSNRPSGEWGKRSEEYLERLR
jgi:Tfp pilus assembly protein PilF